MKNSIALINASINLKANNGNSNYNFYKWLRSAQHQFRPDLTLAQLWQKVCYAATTETSCKQTFSTIHNSINY